MNLGGQVLELTLKAKKKKPFTGFTCSCENDFSLDGESKCNSHQEATKTLLVLKDIKNE